MVQRNDVIKPAEIHVKLDDNEIYIYFRHVVSGNIVDIETHKFKKKLSFIKKAIRILEEIKQKIEDGVI